MTNNKNRNYWFERALGVFSEMVQAIFLEYINKIIEKEKKDNKEEEKK